MNWEAIGAVGEALGAIAVIVTLIYLAIQTRKTGKVMRATAIWDSQISFVAINETLADGGTISEIGGLHLTGVSWGDGPPSRWYPLSEVGGRVPRLVPD